MLTNCQCKTKYENWTFDRELGCWYVERECEKCKYYFEGPDHTKTNVNVLPTTNTPVPAKDVSVGNSRRDRKGKYRIYCYDENGNYGIPVQFDEVNDIFEFCELNKWSHNKINVIDRTDEICVQVVSGLYVSPLDWEMFN